jgi:hypothetical protein
MTDLYLVTTKNLENFLTAIIAAQTPDRFTQKFLESLEFKSANDRLFIKMLKELGFLDASGVPTERYNEYLDQTQSKVVLAKALREAYSDLFKVNTKANQLSEKEVKGKIKTLTGGKRSDNVYNWMSKTFVALCSQADFSTSPATIEEKPKVTPDPLEPTPADDQNEIAAVHTALSKPLSLHYNIQIILPDTRDHKVYEAIFSSLRKHLS